MNFHHIGIATQNIEETIELYKKLGYNLRNETIYIDKIQKVKLAFMVMDDTPLIELVAPIAEDSPIQSILKKNNTTPYHTCYEVDNINESIKYLKSLRFVALSKPVPAIAFNDRLICFLYHPNVGLIELLNTV
jgi:methylmalonyl-CoA/ethylmalonyl-CoA epimerase